MIEEITIRNFKSIKEQTIKLRAVNILIGANNSGKSNLLDALTFYQRMLAMEIQEVFGPGPFSFKSVFYRGGNIKEESMDVEIKYTRTQTLMHKFKLTSYNNYFNRDQGPIYLLKIKEESIIDGDKEEKTKDKSDLLFKSKWTNHELDSAASEFFRSCRSTRKFQFVPNAIKKERSIDPLDQNIPFLSRDGENLVNVLYCLRDKDQEKFRDIMDDFKKIFPEVNGLSFKHLGESKYALEFTMLVDKRQWRFLGPEISDGFAITLAIITLINTPNTPKIILIEEIENGLNPSTIGVILKRIIKASEKNGIQFIITTHSPVILEHLSDNPEYIIVCTQESGNSRYVPLQDILSKFGGDYTPGESLFKLWFEGNIGGL